jgi:hypothetical protein
MSEYHNVIVNNVEKEQRDNLLEVHGKDQPFADIRMPVSFSDREGESTERRILQRSGMP